MLKAWFVQAWMSPVTTITLDTTFQHVINMLKQAEADCLVVVDDNEIVGIITSGDVRAALPGDKVTRSIWDINNTWEKITVRQIMSDQVRTIQPHAEITHAANMMLQHNISRLPVVDRRGHLVGIITSRDIYRMLVHTQQEKMETATPV